MSLFGHSNDTALIFSISSPGAAEWHWEAVLSSSKRHGFSTTTSTFGQGSDIPASQNDLSAIVSKGQHRDDQIDSPYALMGAETICALKVVEASVAAALTDLQFGSY